MTTASPVPKSVLPRSRPAVTIRAGVVVQGGVAMAELRVLVEQRLQPFDRPRIPLGAMVLNADAELVIAQPILGLAQPRLRLGEQRAALGAGKPLDEGGQLLDRFE